MKIIFSLFILSSATAMADVTYQCEDYKVHYSSLPTGVFYDRSVVVKSDDTATVVTSLRTHLIPEYSYDLKDARKSEVEAAGYNFINNQNQDLLVSFSLLGSKKVGVLKLQSTMPQQNGNIDDADEYICTP